MPDISSDKTTATTYPPESLYESWTAHADSLDMPISQFMIRMIETGRKQLNTQRDTGDSIRGLRRQLADLQRELERQRTRNKELERQLQHTVHAEITAYVEENPGATTPQIIQHVANTVPSRVAGHLDVLEEDTLELRDDGYYLQDSSAKQDTAQMDNDSE